jgi:hypothetical protein
MGRAKSPLERYLHIASNTKLYKFDTLIRVRDKLREIPLMQRTRSIAEALNRLNAVIDGRYDKDVYDNAIRVSNNVDQAGPLEIAEATRVLNTIHRDDLKFMDALAARRRLRKTDRR